MRRIIDFHRLDFIFGFDFSTCKPAMYIGGVADDYTLTAEEKQMVLYDNAAKLLSL